jgi:hypothetical protein
MRALLIAAAHVADTHSMMAAMHLLTYTGLPGRADFAKHVDVQAVTSAPGVTVLAAWVRDWDALLGDDSGVDLTGNDRRMLEIAASYAAGRPVVLREQAHGLGAAHAQRLVEAVAIGAGVEEYLRIAETIARWVIYDHEAALAGPQTAE